MSFGFGIFIPDMRLKTTFVTLCLLDLVFLYRTCVSRQLLSKHCGTSSHVQPEQAF